MRPLVSALGVGLVLLTLSQLVLRREGAPERPAVDPVPMAQEASAAAAPFYPPDGGPGWTRLGVTAAHASMVVRVTTEADADPMAVARAIVAPLKPNYVEILVYFHEADLETAMPLRRIQWTPRAGFVEIVFSGPESDPA